MPRSVTAVLLALLCAAASPAGAEDGNPPVAPAQEQPKTAEPTPAPETPAAEPPAHKSPRRGVMAMKPIVCRAVEDGKGKSGQELANAIEQVVLQLHQANYALIALMPGETPIACFVSKTDSSKLPRGAR